MGFLLGETELPANAQLAKTITIDSYQQGKVNKREAWDRLFDASRDAQLYRENFSAPELAKAEAYKRRADTIFSLTGQQLSNPTDINSDGWYPENPHVIGNARTEDQVSERKRDLQDQWTSKTTELAQQFPEYKELFLGSIEKDVSAMVRSTEADEQGAVQKSTNAEMGIFPKMGALLGGSFAGMARDPIQVASLFVGAGAGAGRTVLVRTLQVILAEAAISGGVEAGLQASSFQWKKDAGLNPTFEGGLKQVGLSALFGGGFGGLIQGGSEVARLLGKQLPADRLERATHGDVAEIEAIANDFDVALSPSDRTALSNAAEQDELKALAVGRNAPQNASADRLVDDAIHAIEQDGSLSGFPTEELPSNPQDNFAFFDPNELLVDAARFQFKDGGDELGVTDRLKGIESWNPERAGVIVVFEDARGRRFVADGHQRTGLAGRLNERVEESIQLPGYVYRESDGFSAEDVRAIAALKNIAEGSGTAIDAAKVLRSNGGFSNELNLPPSSALVRDAGGLSRLSNDAFTMAVNGIIKPQLAAVVGRKVANKDIQSQIIQVLKESGATTIADAESMVGDLMNVRTVVETQDDFFGQIDTSRLLLKESAKVRAAALNTLKKDKQVFSMLAREENRVASAGNVLNTDANLERADTNATLITTIDKLSRRTGPIADAFNEAAERVAAGESASRSAQSFIDTVRAEIENAGGDISRIGANRPELDPANPENLAPRQTAEPGSSDALSQSQTALDEIASSEADIDILDAIPAGKDADGNIIHTTHIDMLDEADRDDLFGDIIGSCKE